MQTGNNDEAIDLLTKQAEQIQELIEKSEETPPEDPIEPEDNNDPVDDPGNDEGDPGELTPEKQPIEKMIPVQFTKVQGEWLQKFVEMYISAGDIADFVNQFEEIKNRVAQIEKQFGCIERLVRKFSEGHS